MKRREFLSALGAGGIGAVMPGTVTAGAADPKVLVIVELNGGNDGLNTVVPYHDRNYYKLRPKLAISRDQVLQLGQSVGLNPALEPLMKPWKANELAIVQGVGYPHPNRSHFRAIEIWDSGSGADDLWTEGWLAKSMSTSTSDDTHAIVLGRGNLGPVAGEGVSSLVMRDPKRFIRRARRFNKAYRGSSNPGLAHILSVQTQLRIAAEKLDAQGVANTILEHDFPKSAIGRQLGHAAAILKSGAQVMTLKLSHGSFDTHSNQAGQHRRLLTQLAEALTVFRAEMLTAGRWDDVLVMTYSEFGRRVAENASRGTDHGTAAPHFILGGAVKGGLYGRQPSLMQLDNGDLRYSVDFRSVYATVLETWWQQRDPRFSSSTYPLLKFI